MNFPTVLASIAVLFLRSFVRGNVIVLGHVKVAKDMIIS